MERWDTHGACGRLRRSPWCTWLRGRQWSCLRWTCEITWDLKKRLVWRKAVCLKKPFFKRVQWDFSAWCPVTEMSFARKSSSGWKRNWFSKQKCRRTLRLSIRGLSELVVFSQVLIHKYHSSEWQLPHHLVKTFCWRHPRFCEKLPLVSVGPGGKISRGAKFLGEGRCTGRAGFTLLMGEKLQRRKPWLFCFHACSG